MWGVEGCGEGDSVEDGGVEGRDVEGKGVKVGGWIRFCCGGRRCRGLRWEG